MDRFDRYGIARRAKAKAAAAKAKAQAKLAAARAQERKDLAAWIDWASDQPWGEGLDATPWKPTK